MSNFGKRVERIRQVKRLNKLRFAEAIGVGRQSLYDWAEMETGSDTAILKIQKAFPDINPIWLKTGEGEMFKPSPNTEIAKDVGFWERLVAAKEKLEAFLEAKLAEKEVELAQLREENEQLKEQLKKKLEEQ